MDARVCYTEDTGKKDTRSVQDPLCHKEQCQQPEDACSSRRVRSHATARSVDGHGSEEYLAVIYQM